MPQVNKKPLAGNGKLVQKRHRMNYKWIVKKPFREKSDPKK